MHCIKPDDVILTLLQHLNLATCPTEATMPLKTYCALLKGHVAALEECNVLVHSAMVAKQVRHEAGKGNSL